VLVIIGLGSVVFIIANKASGGAVGDATKTAVKTAATKKVIK
jgi:hypothetical protein